MRVTLHITQQINAVLAIADYLQSDQERLVFLLFPFFFTFSIFLTSTSISRQGLFSILFYSRSFPFHLVFIIFIYVYLYLILHNTTCYVLSQSSVHRIFGIQRNEAERTPKAFNARSFSSLFLSFPFHFPFHYSQFLHIIVFVSSRSLSLLT